MKTMLVILGLGAIWGVLVGLAWVICRGAKALRQAEEDAGQCED
jgi:hypothetical protein